MSIGLDMCLLVLLFVVVVVTDTSEKMVVFGKCARGGTPAMDE